MSEKKKTIELTESKGFIDRLNKFLLIDNVFILLLMGATAAVVGGTYMLINFGTGAFSALSTVSMLRDGLSGGDYTAAAGYGAGFLIARVLEGPLVGVMDIGGSLMTGVSVGVSALLLSMGITFPFDNIVFALLTGAAIGFILGAVIMIIRKTMPEGVAVGGTEVMMGAGNASGRYLAPMIVIAACSYNPFTGIGAIIGAVLFYKMDKEMTGGVILGAMLFGALFL